MFILEWVSEALHMLPRLSRYIKGEWDDIYCYLHEVVRVILLKCTSDHYNSLLKTPKCFCFVPMIKPKALTATSKVLRPMLLLAEPTAPLPVGGPLHPLFPLLVSCFPQPGCLQHFLLHPLKCPFLPLLTPGISVFVSFLPLLLFSSFTSHSFILCICMFVYACLPWLSIITCCICLVKLYVCISKFSSPMT